MESRTFQLSLVDAFEEKNNNIKAVNRKERLTTYQDTEP